MITTEGIVVGMAMMILIEALVFGIAVYANYKKED